MLLRLAAEETHCDPNKTRGRNSYGPELGAVANRMGRSLKP